MKNISNCTLFAIDCIQPEMAIKALEKTSESLKFEKIILFSNIKPYNFNDSFIFIQIDKINSLDEYSQFVLYKLVDHITTDYCFSAHHDGYVIRPDLWKEDYLKYDYIGAPWLSTAPFIVSGNRVGNGGVSIRSTKLMNYVRRIPNLRGHEDTVICSQLYNHLKQAGFKFAPIDLAATFSVEQPCDDISLTVGEALAFHGKSTPRHKEELKKLLLHYYRDDLIKMQKDDLRDWIRNKAGSQQPKYFLCNASGNLELQQIPEEYCELLDTFRTSNIKTYLELGVGNGGSFFVNSIFLQKTANTIHCVDNIAYRNTHIQQTEEKIQAKVDKLSEMFPDKNIVFYNSSTSDFFAKNQNKYDCIFIDADHTYEGVKEDYYNALKVINERGILVLHDIANTDTGVAKLWSEIKNKHSRTQEYCFKQDSNIGYVCGIGVIFV